MFCEFHPNIIKSGGRGGRNGAGMKEAVKDQGGRRIIPTAWGKWTM